ncbi:hypothetical protein H9Q69_010215 [Fusarium xylarioides]|nr:hypothetical protein H9Q69_010215 [Fusarium xylarioides]
MQKQLDMNDEKDNRACRQHLFKTDPSNDMGRILDGKGKLVHDSYNWVVGDPQFLDWQNNPQQRRLWIRGDPGKGKTMMLCGIIEELKKDPFCRLCYFFCQATDENLRDATNVLRGLLYHLIKQYPWLISHVRKEYDDCGGTLFENHNAWEALRKIFKSALEDERFHEVIIIIDALDECVVQREKLLDFICDVSSGSRAKLLVSSRPWPSIEKVLRSDGERSATLALEQNDPHFSLAIQHFIERRVEELAKHRPYKDDPDICEEITAHFTKNAEGTFLWVALVCKELSSNDVQNIYSLEAPDVMRSEICKPNPDPLSSLAYSCIHWADHLYASIFPKDTEKSRSTIRSEDLSAVTTFLRSKFLFWIEALSFLGQVSPGVLAIQTLQRILGGESSQGEQPLSEFVHDANRFLLYYKSIIEKHLLQLYASCLIFSPEQSIIKSQYGSEAPKWIAIAPGLESNWDACLQTLDEHQTEVSTLAYSPDGQWLVSGSQDGVVKLWHADSGACIRTVGGHGLGYDKYDPKHKMLVPAGVKSVAFSADGESFTSGAWNGIVKVWDRATGKLSAEHQAHESHATAMAISSDGLTFAFVLPEGIIKTWSMNKKIPSRSFPCPEHGAYSVALSTDGGWIAATNPRGYPECITWNTSNEKYMGINTGYRAFSVVWSTDAEWVATGGDNGIVRIWEKQSSQWIQKIGVQSKLSSSDTIIHLSFSRDGQFLAGCCRFTISVWNTENGALTWGMDGDMSSIMLSPAALRLASGSWPRTIKIWDLSKVAESRLRHPADVPRQLYYSGENHFTAYYPGANEIRVWGEASLVPKRFYVEDVSAFVLSPDNQLLASATSKGSMITIWNIQTGAVR